MRRREFVQAGVAALAVAGCGGGSDSSGLDDGVLRVNSKEVLVSDARGTLYRITPSAHTVSRLGAADVAVWTVGARGTGPEQFYHPIALAVDDGGRVYVVDRGNARVQVLDGLSGKFLGQFGVFGRGNGQLRSPRHVAVAQDRIYVSDQLNHRIAVFDAKGVPVRTIGRFGTGPAELNFPRGVCVDAAGNVYVADAGSRRVKAYTSNGTFSGAVDQSGDLKSPHGLAFDEAAGRIWVADGIANRVVALTLAGAVQQTFVTRLGDGRAAAPLGISLGSGRRLVYGAPNGPAV